MEGAASRVHDADEKSGRQIRFTAVMKGSQRPDILSSPKHCPRFSATTAEEGRTGAAVVGRSGFSLLHMERDPCCAGLKSYRGN
jgi:hypothetical protein